MVEAERFDPLDLPQLSDAELHEEFLSLYRAGHEALPADPVRHGHPFHRHQPDGQALAVGLAR